MSPFIDQSDLSDQLLLLTEVQQQNPFFVLEDFFEDNSLPEIRFIFLHILKTCLTTDIGPFGEAEKRANLLNLHIRMQAVFEAVYIIAKLRASPHEE